MSSSLILHKNNKLFLRLWDVMESGFYMTTGNDQLSSWTEKKLQNTSQSQSVSCSVVSNSLRPHGQWLTRLLCPWNSPGKSTGVGSHSFLQGIFLTRDRTGSLALQADSLPSEPPGKPFPKPDYTKKRSWSLCGGLLPIWSITAFSICWNYYIWDTCSANWWDAPKSAMLAAGIGQQKGPNSSLQQGPTAPCTTKASKIEQMGLQSFASSAIFT